MGRRQSKAAKVYNAMRRHRRRLAKRDRQVSLRETAAVAIREANPRTGTGVVLHATTMGAMDATGLAWRHRIRLAPVLATGAVVPAAAIAPGQTATGLAVAGVAGLLAAQAPRDHPDGLGEQRARRRLGVFWWAGGCLVWMGAGRLGVTETLVWWQDLAVLAATAGPGALVWWRRPALSAPVPVDPGTDLPAAALILGQTLEALCQAQRSPLEGGRVLEVLYPATNVAVALVELPGGVHSGAIDASLQLGLEAYLERAGRAVLGGMEVGSVKVEPAGVGAIKVTASWSRALDQGILPWTPPADLAAGLSWLGVDDAREQLIVPSFEVGKDEKVSAIHTWVIGRNGGGKSTTLRTLLAPGITSGCELLILADGKGDSLAELAPYAAGGAVARSADAWRQAITLAYAIMVARQQRLGTPQAWRCPTPEDPLITLVIDECATVLSQLTGAETRMMVEMGRMGRSLGVRTIQSGQIPLVDTVIGGSEWRSQARLVLGHGVQDAVHDRIATQSGGTEGPSLLGLPTGRIVVMLDGRLVASRARVALLGDAELSAAAAGSPRAALHPDDLTGHVPALLTLATEWGHTRPAPVVDLTGLLAEWTDDELAPAGAVPAGAIPAATPRRAVPAQDAESGLRQAILSFLLDRRSATRPKIVEHARELGYSKSGTHKAINQLLDREQVVEEAGRVAPSLWVEANR